MPWTRQQMAARAAREMQDGGILVWSAGLRRGLPNRLRVRRLGWSPVVVACFEIPCDRSLFGVIVVLQILGRVKVREGLA